MNEKEFEEAIKSLKIHFDIKCGIRNYAYYEEMISELYKQLKAYKDKEDKLREYCITKTIKTNLPLYTKEVIAESKIANECLQILDGSE